MKENVDKYGQCVLCHKPLLVERVVDNRVIVMPTADDDHAEYLLDDGSRMRVRICKGCKSKSELNSDKVKNRIMKAVVNGWDLETKNLVEDETRPDWTEERRKKYLDTYSKKSIDVLSEGLDAHVIEDRKKRLNKIMEENKVQK